MNTKPLLTFCFLLAFALNISAPGSLITIPFPLSIPTLNLNLPIRIQPIIISQLQLSSINLKSLSYQWQFTEQSVTVKISNALIMFDWTFKKDKGQGTFTQTQYQIQLGYKLIANNKDRVQVSISSTKSKIGHSKVHLGGNVPEIVAVEVTNLIMNHAAVTFRKVIENAITNVVKSFSSILQTDIKVVCLGNQIQSQSKPVDSSNQNKCVYINTTLTAPPILSNKTLLIQINGAPYVERQQSSPLNPDSALVKSNTSQIQMQVHQKLVQQSVKKVLEILPQKLDFNVTSRVSVVDINSLTLSSVLPKMLEIPQVRNVVVSVTKPQVNVSINQNTQAIQMSGSTQVTIFTQNKSTNQLFKYMKPCELSFQSSIEIVYGWKGISIRIKKLSLGTVQCDQQDINQNYVDPEGFIQNLSVLSVYLKGGVNGGLNTKVTNLQFNGIQAAVTGKVMEKVMMFDLTLNPSQAQATEDSQVKILI